MTAVRAGNELDTPEGQARSSVPDPEQPAPSRTRPPASDGATSPASAKVVRVRADRILLVENVREHVDEGLTSSIAEHGLQQPISVFATGGGWYQVFLGHRRAAACKALGWERIPAIVVPRPANLARHQLVENLHRRGMTGIEIARALRDDLTANPSLTLEDLARMTGRSQAWVSNKLSLLDLPAEIQERLERREISELRAHAMRKVTTAVASTGRPRTLAPADDGSGRSRSVVVPLGTTTGTATIGVDPVGGTVDLVVQDARGHGVFLVLLPEAVRLLQRRLGQAYEAVRPIEDVSA